MSINANEVPSNRVAVQKEILPVGTYPTRLVGVTVLGLHPSNAYKGAEKPPARVMRLTYEFLDEFMADEDGNPDENKPRWLSEEMPFLPLRSDLATSTKRYLALDPLQEHGGDWEELIGTPCMLTLVHNKSLKNGIIYEKVDQISAMRPKEAAKAPDLVNPPLIFNFYAPEKEAWDRLPQWLQNKAKDALDFDGSPLDLFLDAVAIGDKDKPTTKTKVATRATKKVVVEEVEEADEEDNSEW